ncbi:hypothetical protein BJV78DRAFT_1158416 [Lactifluus subvellereus]|nr:hypothetical protein BJV78DRAFT_1158416 [Lactifluus subvellereus]
MRIAILRGSTGARALGGNSESELDRSSVCGVMQGYVTALPGAVRTVLHASLGSVIIYPKGATVVMWGLWPTQSHSEPKAETTAHAMRKVIRWWVTLKGCPEVYLDKCQPEVAPFYSVSGLSKLWECCFRALSPRDNPRLTPKRSIDTSFETEWQHVLRDDINFSFSPRYTQKGHLNCSERMVSCPENSVAGAFRAQKGLVITYCLISSALETFLKTWFCMVAIGKGHSLLHPVHDQVVTIGVYSVSEGVE